MNKLVAAALCIPLMASAHPELEEHRVITRDGHELQAWYLPAPSYDVNAPTIVWVHGLGDYTKRFLEIVAFMHAHGFASMGFDLRGHGKSHGDRGYIHSVDVCGNDVEDVYHFYKNRVTGPVFMVGNSLGGLITTRYLQRQERALKPDRAILLAPALGFNKERVGWFKKIFLDYFGWLFPWYHVSIKAGEKDNPDKNLILHVPLASVKEMDKAFEKAFEDVHLMDTPIHILAGGQETIVDLQAMLHFHELLPDCSKKEFTLYQEMRHYLLGGPGRHQVHNKILALLRNQAD